MTTEKNTAPTNFIRQIIDADLESNKHDGRVVTRFPPEPNGYLHIGHAKSICLNFGLARDYDGVCHMRFDDTNPEKEDVEYTESILNDVRWLGFDWGDKLYYASDYFGQLYDYAELLIKAGKAYVCSLNDEQVREYRGSLSEPGKHSPYRDRPTDENLDLFRRMRAGEFPDGAHILRAKIDMANPNMKMRDPPIYRIRHAHHFRQGDAWCIYPLYDFTHGLSDAIEGITHSICTLEFENNRELYDWFLDQLPVPYRPHQYEFARLNLNYTVMSKRKLLQLVRDGHVNGWDDPRMPTITGMRRRGIPAQAIRAFCDRIGVAKNNSIVDVALFEATLRDHLNPRVPRVLCVQRPLKVVITNWPEGQVEALDAPFYPHDVPLDGSRTVPFTGELWIDRADFMLDPPKRFHRLAHGREVRLRHAYFIRCHHVVRDSSGEVSELHCTYDPDTRGGKAPDGRKVKGTIHWVSASHGVRCEVRQYDRLFASENPGAGHDFVEDLNPDSLEVLADAWIEPSVVGSEVGTRFQFERHGYFAVDPDSTDDRLVFNRIVSLRDSWARLASTPEAAPAKGKARSGKAPRGTRPERKGTKTSEPLSVAAQTLVSDHGLREEDARRIAGDAALSALFGAAVAKHPNPRAAAKWVVNEVRREARDRDALLFDGAALGELVALIDDGTISTTIAREVFVEMASSGAAPGAIVEKRGMRQVSDTGALSKTVAAVLAAHPKEVERFRAGEKRLMGFFVGQIMRASGGKANAKVVNQLLAAKLG